MRRRTGAARIGVAAFLLFVSPLIPVPAPADVPINGATPAPSSSPAAAHEIGSVKATLSGSGGISRGNPSVGAAVPAQALRQENALRVSDSLKKLSGVDASGTTAAAGDDAYISLRGLKPSESQVLLDGHPIGPIGVSASGPDTDGLVEGFNFQASPAFALSGADVTFGAGAAGLYGGGAVGGTIDMHTLNPSARNEFTLDEGLGDQGRMLTALRATGTRGRLGYALADGVEGTFGAFSGGSIVQTGLRGTDFTSATLRQLTYPVSGAYLLRNALGKVAYKLSSATNVVFAAYNATSWSDKTGNGDNDFNAPAYMLAQAPVGNDPSCPKGVMVRTDGGMRCLSPRQYAQDASGPAGGGPGAWQALRNQDYHARITSTAGKSSLLFDAFVDSYAFTYNRDASFIQGAADAFSERWSTRGFLVSDDIVRPRNAFGFGSYMQRQALTGDQSTADASSFVENTPASRWDHAYFVRDVFTATNRLSLIINAWYDKVSGDLQGHLNPRASLLYKPSAFDTVRLTSGQSVSEPSLQLDQVRLTPIGALNPDCGAVKNASSADPADVNVGSGPGSSMLPEKATDIELSYERRFGGDSYASITAYDMNITDRIVAASLPAGSLPESVTSSILNRIETFCGTNPAPDALRYTLTRAFNAATARSRGIEIAGRVHAGRRVFLDYAYDIQSMLMNDIPTTVLASDPTLINGAQAFGVPLHKANLGIDLSTPSGFEGRIDGHFIGENNPQQLPGYAYADLSLTQRVSKRLTINLGVSNVFNTRSNIYSMTGLGVPYPVNAENTALGQPFAQPFNVQSGLPQTSILFNAELRM